MANQWFRMYSEFSHDPKVQMMSEAMQRRLIMLFCDRSCDVTVTLTEQEIAFRWRISDAELAETKSLFISKGFIDENWNVLNWDKRQFVSDSSTDRTRRYRERQRTSRERHSGDGGDGGDMPEQNRTEQKQNIKPDVSDDDDIDPNMAVSGILDGCRIGGRELRIVLDEQARIANKAGENLKQWSEQMINAWKFHEESRPKLKAPPGAEKFFGQGYWRNPSGWIWKDGMEPRKKSEPAKIEPRPLDFAIPKNDLDPRSLIGKVN